MTAMTREQIKAFVREALNWKNETPPTAARREVQLDAIADRWMKDVSRAFLAGSAKTWDKRDNS